MDIAQIRHFLYLSETLSFTKAAALAGISQPSLTRSIKRLEQELGGDLLYRDGKDTRLTPLGRDVQIEFMHIAQREERVRSLAEVSIRGKRETVTIGVSVTLSPLPVSRFINQVIKALPNVEIVLRPLNHGAGPERVLSGELDGCFLSDGPESHAKLSVINLFHEALLLGCSPSHRFADMDEVPAAEMAKEHYIDRTDCEFRTAVIKRLMDNNVLMQPRIHSEREDLVQQLVVDGDAICMMPEFSAIAHKLVLRRVTELDLSRCVSFLAVSGASYGPALTQIRSMAERFDWDRSVHV